MILLAKLCDTVATGQGLSVEETRDLATELNDETTWPLAQAFSVIASKPKDQHVKRQERLVEGLKSQDQVPVNAIKATPLSHSAFFAQDITDVIKEAANRASIKAMVRAAQPRQPQSGWY